MKSSKVQLFLLFSKRMKTSLYLRKYPPSQEILANFPNGKKVYGIHGKEKVFCKSQSLIDEHTWVGLPTTPLRHTEALKQINRTHTHTGGHIQSLKGNSAFNPPFTAVPKAIPLLHLSYLFTACTKLLTPSASNPPHTHRERVTLHQR